MGATLSVAALLAFFLEAVFFLAFLVFLAVSGWVAFSGMAEAEGTADAAPAVSAAKTGAAKIKAHSNNSNFFMVILPLWLRNKYGLPSTGAARQQHLHQLLHQANLSLAYTSRPLLKRGLSRSISAY